MIYTIHRNCICIYYVFYKDINSGIWDVNTHMTDRCPLNLLYHSRIFCFWGCPRVVCILKYGDRITLEVLISIFVLSKVGAMKCYYMPQTTMILYFNDNTVFPSVHGFAPKVPLNGIQNQFSSFHIAIAYVLCDILSCSHTVFICTWHYIFHERIDNLVQLWWALTVVEVPLTSSFT
jgi:hypothetical protein